MALPLRVVGDRFQSLGVALLATLVVGCQPASTPVTKAPTPLTPEERFSQIVSTLEEQINDGSLDAASAAADADAPPGAPITSATVRVSHEVFPRKSDSEPLRAKICLTTKGTVMVTLPQPTDEEQEAAKEDQKKKQSEFAEDLEGIADLESLRVPKSEGLAGRLGSSSVHEIEQGDRQSCFELEYRDGKWELLTELDRENEPFNALAIEYALRKQ